MTLSPSSRAPLRRDDPETAATGAARKGVVSQVSTVYTGIDELVHQGAIFWHWYTSFFAAALYRRFWLNICTGIYVFGGSSVLRAIYSEAPAYPMVLTGAREAQVMTEEQLKQLHEGSGAWGSNSSWTR